MFERQVLKVIGYNGCDAFRCDDAATTGFDVQHTGSKLTAREYWCDAHARERRQQVSAHSRLLIVSEYTLEVEHNESND